MNQHRNPNQINGGYPLTPKARAATAIKPNTTKQTTKKKRTKKYNNFNIFFMLERQLLLQSRGGGINAIETPIDTSNLPMVKHKELHLPPLCHRYNHLPLTSNWFLELLANQNKKRRHIKSHGLIPFKELAQTVAKNYREIDDETQSFVNEVAERLGWHCEEMAVAEEQEQERQEKRRLDLQLLPSNSSPENGHDDNDKRLYTMASSWVDTTGPKVGFSVLGASVYANKKRKDAPVVFVAGRGAQAATADLAAGLELPSLRQNDAATSHSPPQGHHPNANGYPSDTEANRLQLELAHAMSSRLESELRIRLLEKQMAIRHVSMTTQSQPVAYNRPAVARHYNGQVAAHPRSTPQDSNMISPSVLRHLPAGYEQYLSMLSSASRDDTLASPDSQLKVASKAAAAAVTVQSRQLLPFHHHSRQTSSRASVYSHNSPTSIANTTHNDQSQFHNPNRLKSLTEVENALLKKAVHSSLIPNAHSVTGARRWTPRPSIETLEALGYPMNVLHGRSRGVSQDHHPQSNRAVQADKGNVDGRAHLKKRARYSDYLEHTAKKSTEEEYYKDLYSNLVTSSMMATASARDAAAKWDHQLAETAAAASKRQDLDWLNGVNSN